MKSFFGELKRRNVVRVGVLYGIVGWLVLQVADLVIPALGIPPWGISLVVVLVALGFPIALVLAWAFEVTPEGIKRTHAVEHQDSITHLTGRKLDFLIIGVLAAALVYVAVDLFVLRERGMLAPRPHTASSDPSLISIAVLPFADMSQAKDQEYLTDGISEELLNVLSRIDGFKVTGRTSAFAFKGRNEDLRTIGQKLNVENILEGSVRKQGDRIRVTAQLVKAADGYHLWSETYDRQLGDVFAIQDEIARQVVGAIRTKLVSGDTGDTRARPAEPLQRAPTDNVEAWTHFLRGQHLLRTRERAGMEGALVEFEKAVVLDPQFARARVGIANSLVLLGGYGMRDISSIEARAKAELERALAIEPGLPDAYAGQAVLMSVTTQSGSEQISLLERAVAGNPSDSQALVWLGQSYGYEGRAADELRAYANAYAIDPLSPIVLQSYAWMCQTRGHRKLSRRIVDELVALDPDSAVVDRLRADLALEDGRIDESVRWTATALKRDPDDPGSHGMQAVRYLWLGDYERGWSHVARMQELTPGSEWAVSLEIYLRLAASELDAAGTLVRAAEERNELDPDLLRARATYLMRRGEYAPALEALLEATPQLRAPAPKMGYGPVSWDASMAAFLFGATGDEAQKRRLADAFARSADGYWKPVEGVEQGASLWLRAQMAAVTGDRAALIGHLAQYHEHGGLLPAYFTLDPWLRPYDDDPGVANLLAKFDARRQEAVRRLRAQGL